jgi:hypothetical protein
MTNPTSNFGWQMPTPTDLVTDLPADFEVFGQAVDTSMADLKGGTTGQILSKATNADMDFTWITNDVGDITNIAVTSPITGGGSSGSVTIGVDAATTSAAGVVQLTNSTSSTSTTTAATPSSVKSAFDLATTANTAAGTAQTTANAAIPKSTVTTAGDVIYATGSAAVTRLGVGSAGQVLTVAGGVPTWATPAGGGSLTLLSTTAITAAATISITGISTSYKNLFVYMDNFRPDRTSNLKVGTFNTSTALQMGIVESRNANGTTSTVGNTASEIITELSTTSVGRNVCGFTISQYATTGNHPIQGTYAVYATGAFGTGYSFGNFGGATFATASAVAINRLDFSFASSGGNFTAQGNIYIYGVN